MFCVPSRSRLRVPGFYAESAVCVCIARLVTEFIVHSLCLTLVDSLVRSGFSSLLI